MKNIKYYVYFGIDKILNEYVTIFVCMENVSILQKNRWKNLRVVAVKYWKGCIKDEEI
jgi:hypothetical protein